MADLSSTFSKGGDEPPEGGVAICNAFSGSVYLTEEHNANCADRTRGHLWRSIVE